MLWLSRQQRTPISSGFILLSPHHFQWWTELLLVLFLAWAFMPQAAAAQTTMAGGWAVEVYGIVQVEPDPKVLTFAVKKENIRFAIHNVHSSNPRFPIHRFLSENRKRVPGIYIKGPDAMLETLIQEKPGERVLKLNGVYYPDSRTLVLNSLRPLEKPPQ